MRIEKFSVVARRFTVSASGGFICCVGCEERRSESSDAATTGAAGFRTKFCGSAGERDQQSESGAAAGGHLLDLPTPRGICVFWCFFVDSEENY